MDIYSVVDVSKILGVNEETVRRWIRTGKLDGVMSSRKDGIRISYDSLVKFLSEPENLRYNTNIPLSSVKKYGVDRLVGEIKAGEKRIDILHKEIGTEEDTLARNRELLSGLIGDGIVKVTLE